MLLSPPVYKAISMLESAGYEAYLVGGAVRDSITGSTYDTDWNLATNAVPEQVKMVFYGYRTIETGLKHGTVTVLVDDEPLEITTYRIDRKYRDNRRPDSVTFARSLREDLARRDFTMNALAYNPRTGIVDDFGGQEDLRNGIIRCVGDPDKRFQEDGLRILRALRFSSVFSMEIAPQTAEAIHRNKGLLQNIAVERIRVELTKMLRGYEVDFILRDYSDVMAVVIPELEPMFCFKQHNKHHCYDVWRHTIIVVQEVSPTPVLKWAALFHDIGKPHTFSMDEHGTGHFYGHAGKSTEIADMVMRRMRFDNASREDILFLVKHHDIQLAPNEKSVKRAIQRYGITRLRQLIDLFEADTCGQSEICSYRFREYDLLRQMIDNISGEKEKFDRSDLALNGNDLIQIGYQGKRIGSALDYLVDAVLFDGVHNDKDSLISCLRTRDHFEDN